MNRNTFSLSFLVLTLAGLSGCSSKPPANESKKAAPDKIQGKAQVIQDPNITEAAMNAGGPSVYLVDGLHRYRLFFNKAVEVVAGKEYVAEGVYAQKAIDDMGDPDQGKNGYPLPGRCESVVKMAWSNLAFDVTDGHSSALCGKVKRYPARAIFLVTRLQPVDSKSGADSKKDQGGEEKEIPEVSVPADKQRASLMEGPTVQTAPLWDPKGGTVRCKVVIGPDGKISELATGIQLCEIVPWSQFRYQPPVQRGHPVKVNTEVEVRFEARK
ncbi:MAG TPA: hypothetical protein VEU96_31035 [Bryobacteraceae bacterium]|nr:hypothetical protein [Bryobacteraceae bacterium]